MNKLKIWRGKTVAFVGGTFITVMGSANAALDTAVVDGIKTEVLSDIGLAVAAGFAILGVSLASSVGMSLIGRFISKGAKGG